MSSPAAEKSWVPLSPRERRVVGVLVEKQKTTPAYYPMTIAALVAASNQKSNRDPITNYDDDQVEETLEGLRLKGAVARVEGQGRVPKWRHLLYEWLGLKDKPVAMAIVAELLLRGPQTEGELRGRANRMDPIPELPALQALLEDLATRGLVVFLTPPGQRRGVVVTHGLYPPEELDRVRDDVGRAAVAIDEEVPARPRGEGGSGSSGWSAEAAALRAEVEGLRESLRALAAEVRDLKAALGA